MPMFVPVPRNETVLRERGSYPGRLNLLSRKATAVQRAIRREGLAGFEPETQATLLTLVQLAPRPLDFFDVGAHIGLYSLLVSAIFGPAVRSTAFEPTPTTQEIAHKLAARNKLPITLEPLAVGAEPGTATMYLSDKAETSNSLVAGFRASSEAITVQQTTVDAYCSARGLTPSVMKVDVETYEAYVLAGAMKTLATRRTAVVCEVLPKSAAQSEATLSTLEAVGYHVHVWEGAGGWQGISVADLIAPGRPSRSRDILLTPEPLTDHFRSTLAEWLAAVAACTPERNLLVAPGQRAPAGWGAPHRL